MNGNRIDAEDALSCAMLKAWEKAQKYVGEIANFKAWLIRLTYNLCIDIHREGKSVLKQVENIDAIAPHEEQRQELQYDTLVSDLDQCEKKIVIRHAINNLPTRLRETFILHFYQELSYQEIAQQQEISYQNVCKRISQARAILRNELKEYFIGEDGTQTELSVISALAATESLKEEKSNNNVGVELIVDEMTLSSEVEEVEIVADEEPQKTALSEPQRDLAMVATVANEKLELNSPPHKCTGILNCYTKAFIAVPFRFLVLVSQMRLGGSKSQNLPKDARPRLIPFHFKVDTNRPQGGRGHILQGERKKKELFVSDFS